MNQNTSFIFSFFVMFSLFLIPVTVSASVTSGASSSPGEGMTVTVRKDGVDITCPDQISYQIQPPFGQWDAGLDGLKHLKFASSGVENRLLFCTYSVDSGMAKDTSTITKPMPAGYICTVYFSGEKKRRQFDCKRAVAPIKIKPKSD